MHQSEMLNYLEQLYTYTNSMQTFVNKSGILELEIQKNIAKTEKC